LKVILTNGGFSSRLNVLDEFKEVCGFGVDEREISNISSKSSLDFVL